MTNNDQAKRRLPIALGLLALLGMLVFLRLSLGTESLSFSEIFGVLRSDPAVSQKARNIILELRLPRLLTALLSGAALGLSGLAMQTLFRNPLADPYVLGISSGSTLGVATFIMIANLPFAAAVMTSVPWLFSSSMIISAALGAGLVFAVILLVSTSVRSTLTLLIIGMLIGYLVGALVAVLMRFSSQEELQRFIHWTFGSFKGVTRDNMMGYSIAIVVGLLIILSACKSLNAFLLGENYARSMGTNVTLTRLQVICGSSLLAGTVTAYCGPIAFLGIAIPHLCRGLFRTSDHRVLMPAVIVLGASMACVADILTTCTSKPLPLNAISALIGAPVIISIILGRRHMENEA